MIALRLFSVTSLTVSKGEQSEGWTGLRCLLVMSLTWALGRQHTAGRNTNGIPYHMVGIWNTVSQVWLMYVWRPQKGIVLISFLVEAVLRRGVDLLALGNLLGELSTTFSLTCPLSSRTSNLLHKGIWEGEGRVFSCNAKQGPASIPPHLIGPLPWWWQGRGSATFWGVSPQCLCCRYGRESLYQSCLLRTFPDAP